MALAPFVPRSYRALMKGADSGTIRDGVRLLREREVGEEYRALVEEILLKDARFPPSHGDIEAGVVFDDERQSYQLMFIGWDKNRRVHGPVIHVRLRNDKIWIDSKRLTSEMKDVRWDFLST